MNNTPIQKLAIFLEGCFARTFAALLLVMALTGPWAQARETSPHWEEINGVSRYGYWQEGTATGYWDETAGYWDYSGGFGHEETRYVNARWELDENEVPYFVEDAVTVWVEDPIWVSMPQYVDQSTSDTWVDLEPPQDPTPPGRT